MPKTNNKRLTRLARGQQRREVGLVFNRASLKLRIIEALKHDVTRLSARNYETRP